jgi:ATP phosphoribosyltransferase
MARLTRPEVSQKYVTCRYNIQADNLEKARQIARGKRSPTVTALYPEQDGWVAVEVMIEKRELADKMDALWEIGAQDIVVFSLLNTRTAD